MEANHKHGPDQLDFGELLFPGRKVLTVGEVARTLGVTEQHLHNLIEAGTLRAVDVGGGKRRHWRIPVGEYERFLKARVSA